MQMAVVYRAYDAEGFHTAPPSVQTPCAGCAGCQLGMLDPCGFLSILHKENPQLAGFCSVPVSCLARRAGLLRSHTLHICIGAHST